MDGKEVKIMLNTLTIIIKYTNNNNNSVGGQSTAVTGDPRDTTFPWQRISVLLQRFNAILISETFVEAGDAPDL